MLSAYTSVGLRLVGKESLVHGNADSVSEVVCLVGMEERQQHRNNAWHTVSFAMDLNKTKSLTLSSSTATRSTLRASVYAWTILPNP